MGHKREHTENETLGKPNNCKVTFWNIHALIVHASENLFSFDMVAKKHTLVKMRRTCLLPIVSEIHVIRSTHAGQTGGLQTMILISLLHVAELKSAEMNSIFCDFVIYEGNMIYLQNAKWFSLKKKQYKGYLT